jgi:C-terminal peptidase prc
MQNREDSLKTKRLLPFFLKTVGLITVVLTLAGCTIGPAPTVFPTNTPAPRITPSVKPTELIPTLTPAPPPPTATTRPALPATPSGVTLTKRQVLQEGFDFLIRNYYSGISSADVYELALRGVQAALDSAKVPNAQVPFPNFTGNLTNDFDAFIRSFTIVVGRHGSQVSEEVLAYSAFIGASSSLRECQTAFYPPSTARDHLQNRVGLGENVGIGVNVIAFPNQDGLHVTRVTPNSPSAKAGIGFGDAILEVDGTVLGRKSLNEMVRILLGGKDRAELNTQVRLKVQKAGSTATQEYTLTRAATRSDWLEARIFNADNVAYLRFNAMPLALDQGLQALNTQLDEVLRDFNTRNVKGIVLDLRGTRWGSVLTMQNILSRFISGNNLVYLRANRNNQNSVIGLTSIANVTAINKPLALLVDGSTANEAEIFTVAFKQSQIGRIFGNPTAGCVVAANPASLSDNSIFNVATYRALSDPQDPASIIPAVEPDEALDFDYTALRQGQDSILQKAIDYIKARP